MTVTVIEEINNQGLNQKSKNMEHILGERHLGRKYGNISVLKC